MTDTASRPLPPICVRRYEDLIAVLRDRRQALGLTLNELDSKAGFYEGYSAHIERWEGPNGRGLGPVSLPLILEALGLAIVLVEADAIAPGAEPVRRLSQKELTSRTPLKPRFGPARLSDLRPQSETPAALLRAARAVTGATLDQAAQAIGVDRKTLIEAEAGRRLTDRTWARLSDWYQKSNGLRLDAAGGRLVIDTARDRAA